MDPNNPMKIRLYSSVSSRANPGMSRAMVNAMRRLPRRKVLAWAGVSLLGAPACISPTLPLPPPEVPDALRVGEYTYRLRGALPMLGNVFVVNKRTSDVGGRWSVIQYEFNVTAQPGDEMIIWYETISDISSGVVFIIDRANPIVGDGGL